MTITIVQAPAPAVANRRFAPSRRIVGREVRGNRVTDRLECGHILDEPYTGYQVSRRCPHCLADEEPIR